MPRRETARLATAAGNGGGNHQPEMHRRTPLSLEDAAENECAKQRLGVGEACPGAVGQGRARAECSSLQNERSGQARHSGWKRRQFAKGRKRIGFAGGVARAGFHSGAPRVPTSDFKTACRRMPASPSHRPDAAFNLRGRGLLDNTVWAGKFKDLQTSKTFTSKNCGNFRYALSRIRGVSHIERTRRNGTLGMDEFMNSDERARPWAAAWITAMLSISASVAIACGVWMALDSADTEGARVTADSLGSAPA